MRIDIRPILAVGACALLAACSSATSPATSSTPAAVPDSGAPPSSTSPSPSGPRLVEPVDIESAGATRIVVPGGMDWIVVAGGSAWTSNEAITRLDGRTGKVLSTIAIDGATCLAPAEGFGSLWFGVCGAVGFVRVDVATGKVVARIPVKVSDLLEESSVGTGAGRVWALSASGEIVEVDPGTNTVARISPAPAGASAIRASSDALWVTIHGGGTLLRLNPATLATTATIRVGDGPRFLALAEGSVWTLDQTSGTVTRVDQRTNMVLATIRVDTGSVEGGDIAVGGGFVWARVTDQLVAKIDPRTNAVVARYSPAAGSGGAAADGSAAWITAHDSNSVYRLPLS